MMPALLLTRPAAASARFAEEIGRDRPGLQVVIAPLIEIRALPVPEMVPPAAVVLASGNAVRAFAQQGEHRPPAFVVGPRTAAAARSEGFDVIEEAPDALSLISAILARPDPGPMLVARGRHVARDITAALRAAGRTAVEAVVYDQAELPPPPGALSLIQSPGPVVLPLFSPRSARLALQALGPAGLGRFEVAAISAAVAEVAEPLARGRIVIASQPDGEAMRGIVQRMLDGPRA